MYRIWCEWDIGCENKLFTTKKAAEKYAKELWVEELEDQVENSYKEAVEYGLIGFTSMEVIA